MTFVVGAALAGFSQFQFRTTVMLLVEALKKAMDGGDISELAKQTEDFKLLPRTLLELIKNMSFATADELDDQTGTTPLSVLYDRHRSKKTSLPKMRSISRSSC